jgi:hypothetical protein
MHPSPRNLVDAPVEAQIPERELGGRFPGWPRLRYALPLAALFVAVPVAVSLLRASHFSVTLEVYPTTPPGNAPAAGHSSPAELNLIANPGFESGVEGWTDPPSFAIRRSTKEAHSGTASLASVRDRRSPIDGNEGYSYIVFPGPGRYRIQAWVRLPRGYSGGPPAVYLDGFAGSRQVAQQLGNPQVRERWQEVSSEYLISGKHLAGLAVFRTLVALPERGQVVYWDDVFVPSRTTNLVSNSGFEYDTSGWGTPPAFAVRRSTEEAHSGAASLASYRDRKTPLDGNAGYTYVVFPRAGTYRAQAWVYLPSPFGAGPPGIYLEAFAGSKLLDQRLGNPNLRNRWQLVSSDYSISAQDLAGSLVLRVVAVLPGRRRVMYWDDVSVSAPLQPEPATTREASVEARRLGDLLAEQQLRLDVSLAAGKDLYRPHRVTVTRNRQASGLGFVVSAASDTPDDARRLAGPLRNALVRAATLSRSQRAEAELGVVTKQLATKLRPRQRLRLEQRADDLRRLIASQPPDFVVVPADSTPGPKRIVDRALDKLPGPFPPRVDPIWAGAAGLLCALLFLGVVAAFTAVRRVAPERRR